jgi:hypothetical protein
MLQTERDEYEALGTSVLVKHIVLDECQQCQATMLLVLPTLVIQPEAQS